MPVMVPLPARVRPLINVSLPSVRPLTSSVAPAARGMVGLLESELETVKASVPAVMVVLAGYRFGPLRVKVRKPAMMRPEPTDCSVILLNKRSEPAEVGAPKSGVFGENLA